VSAAVFMTYRPSMCDVPSCSDALFIVVKPRDKEKKFLHGCHVVICDLPNTYYLHTSSLFYRNRWNASFQCYYKWRRSCYRLTASAARHFIISTVKLNAWYLGVSQCVALVITNFVTVGKFVQTSKLEFTQNGGVKSLVLSHFREKIIYELASTPVCCFKLMNLNPCSRTYIEDFVVSHRTKFSYMKLPTCVMNTISIFETSLLPSVCFVFHSAKIKNSYHLLDICGCINCIFLIVNRISYVVEVMLNGNEMSEVLWYRNK
jgi:hypothetical protein